MSDTYDSIIGRRLQFTVTEPWEFETLNNYNSFDGLVIDVDGEALLFKADINVKIDSSTYNIFVCSPRLKNESLYQLENNNKLWCAATALPHDKAQSDNPFDLSWWRGGGTLIGTLSQHV